MGRVILTQRKATDTFPGAASDVGADNPLHVTVGVGSGDASMSGALPIKFGDMPEPPTSFQLTAVDQVIRAGVEAGAELTFSLAVPNFISGGTFSVAFEKSTDHGTNWVPLTVKPKTLIALRAPVTSATAVGLWRYDVEDGVTDVRMRCTGLTTLTELRGWIELFEDGRKIHLPFLGFTGGTFGLATNNPIVPAIDWDRFGDIEADIQTFTGTSHVMTWQGTTDDAGVNWSGVSHVSTASSTPVAGTTITGSGQYKITPGRQYFRVNLTFTALTAMSINGLTATVTSAVAPPSFVVASGAVAAGGTTGISNPIPAGFQCQTAALTTADGNNRLGLPVMSPGRATVVRQGQIRAAQSQNNVTLTTTTETTLLAAVASLFQDITELEIANTSASAVRIDLRTTTGGAVVRSFNLLAGETKQFTWKTGLLQAAVNTNWTVQASAALTDIRIGAVADRWVG
jgi:hypothetical protein